MFFLVFFFDECVLQWCFLKIEPQKNRGYQNRAVGNEFGAKSGILSAVFFFFMLLSAEPRMPFFFETLIFVIFLKNFEGEDSKKLFGNTLTHIFVVYL